MQPRVNQGKEKQFHNKQYAFTILENSQTQIDANKSNLITNFGSKIYKQLLGISSMKNTKQTIVSMSGFGSDPQMNTYLQMLGQLGCKYVQQLSHDANYVIVNHTCTEKYKIAQLSKSSTQCITLKWLEDSVKSKKILPIQKYRIKKIFYGSRIILQGFEDKKLQDKIAQILKNNGAEEVRISVQGMNTQQINEKYQLIIVPSQRIYRKLQGKISEYVVIPLVTPEWIQESLKCKKCKFPNDYALNYHSINPREYDDSSNAKRLSKKAQAYLQLNFLDKKSGELLCDEKTGDQLIIYLDQNSIELQFCTLLKRLICICGGLYLNNYGPVVTHILVGPIEETQYHKFMNYGDSSNILRVQWLIDSIIFSEKLPEIDFKIRSFKSPLIKSMNNIQMRETFFQRNNLQSQNFAHSCNFNDANLKYSANSLPLTPPLLSKKSSKNISMSKQCLQSSAKLISVTKVRSIKSQMFKGKYFYIQKSQRKQIYMQSIYTKIKQNGGNTLSQNSLGGLKNKKLLVVLRDSQKNVQNLQSIHKLTIGNNIEIIAVSVRWIQQCTKKSVYMDYNGQDYFIFRPFLFETPMRQMMCMKIELVGIQQILKRRYKQLLLALGCNKISPNMSEITHCLCGSDYLNDSRFQAIYGTVYGVSSQKEVTKQQGSGTKTAPPVSNIKFVRVQWLVDMLNSRGKVSMDEYVINVQ